MSEQPFDNRPPDRPDDASRLQSTHNGNGPIRPGMVPLNPGGNFHQDIPPNMMMGMPGGFNPSAGVPAHIQEQLRRQMQAQHMMRLQQQHQHHLMMQQQGLPMGMNMPPRAAYPPPTGAMASYPSGHMNMVRPPPPPHQQHLQRPSQSTLPMATIPAERLAMLSRVKPYSSTMDEQEFMQSLGHFLSCVNIPLKKLPNFNGRPVSLLMLFRTVVTFGGYLKVSETKRWSSVSASVSLPPNNVDCLASLHSIYGTLLYPYEQYMIQKIPASSIQWPLGVARSFTGPPQPERLVQAQATQSATSLLSNPTARLTSALSSRTASEDSTSGVPSTTVPKSPVLQNYTIETVGLQQWKTIKAHSDPFQVLRRGRYSFKDILLLLESEMDYLVTFAINLLQVLTIDPHFSIPDLKIFKNLVAVLHRYASKISYSRTSSSTWELSRKSANRHYELNGKGVNEVSLERLQIITNIMRNLVLRSEVKPFLEQLSKTWVSSLFKWATEVDCLEVRKSSLMILSELLPSCLGAAPLDLVSSYLNQFLLDIELLHPLILSSSARISLSCINIPEDPDTLKKLIIAMIQSSTNFFKSVPALFYVQLEVLYRLALQTSFIQIAEKVKHIDQFQRILKSLLDLILLLTQPIIRLIEVIHQLLQEEDFIKSSEHPKWCQKILHNTAFGLPDLGYLELMLLCVKTIVSFLDDVSSIDTKSLSVLADNFRNLWICPEFKNPIKFERQVCINPAQSGIGRRATQKTFSTVLTDKSPLLWQSCTATNSHPYQLYLLLLKILDDIAMKGSLDVSFETVLRWFSYSDVQCNLSREVLNTPELAELYHRLLESCIETRKQI